MEADTGDYECWAQAESETAQQVKKILKVGPKSDIDDNMIHNVSLASGPGGAAAW